MTVSAKSSFVAASLLLGSFLGSASAGPLNAERSAAIHGVHTLPIQRVETQKNTKNLHPQVVHQQHTNRASQRLAKMTNKAAPSDAELAGHLSRRIASLPAEHQKRYSTEGLLNLESLPAVQSLKSAAASGTPSASAVDSKSTDGYSERELTAYRYNALTVADAPTFVHSSGLDIVANDIGYLTTVMMGTPPSNYRMLVDSGSSDLWVGAENCIGTSGMSCDRHNLLGPRSSSTFINSNKTFSINYGSGNITGDIISDIVNVAGMNITNHTFGVATLESPDFTSEGTIFDGIMGLATPSISVVGGPTVVQALANDGSITDPIVSFYLDRASNATNHGEVTFGAMDSAKYKKNTAVTFQNAVRGYWGAVVENVSAGNTTLNLANRTAILDTGTSMFLVPQADAEALHAAIPGSIYDASSNSWTIPCTTTTKLALSIGGKDFTVDPHDLTFLPVDDSDLTGACLSSISVGSTPADEWLLGDVFLKNVYFSTNVATNEITLAKAI